VKKTVQDTERPVKELVESIQDSAYDIINLLLGGKCKKTDVLTSAEKILEISKVLEKSLKL
jgi:hypothetical protein